MPFPLTTDFNRQLIDQLVSDPRHELTNVVNGSLRCIAVPDFSAAKVGNMTQSR
jgi:hypothetical protein